MCGIGLLATLKKKLRPAIPQEIYGAWEYRCHPQLRDSWGAFNGQSARQSLVVAILEVIDPSVIVETGTHRGTTTAYLRALSTAKIYTIESSRHFWGYSAYRFIADSRVSVVRGDSRTALRKLVRKLTREKDPVFFYLDAHWGPDLPLSEELEAIYSTEIDAVVMIDDFKVPNDDGYAYDDYGPGLALTVDYVEPVIRNHGVDIYFPSVRSDHENGARRGCVVMVKRGNTSNELSKLNGLRIYQHCTDKTFTFT